MGTVWVAVLVVGSIWIRRGAATGSFSRFGTPLSSTQMLPSAVRVIPARATKWVSFVASRLFQFASGYGATLPSVCLTHSCGPVLPTHAGASSNIRPSGRGKTASHICWLDCMKGTSAEAGSSGTLGICTAHAGCPMNGENRAAASMARQTVRRGRTERRKECFIRGVRSEILQTGEK